jgi:uncharacterized membrane protein YphA (DoxX/SURF4 family)
MAGPGGFLLRPVTVRAAQLAIGTLILLPALGKIGDLASFAQQVHNYRLAPLWSQNLIAVTLPWVELLAGLALVLGARPRAGAVILLALMVGFTVAVGAAWARGLDFECGCFGKASASRIGAQKFFENVAWTVVAVVATLRPRASS